MFVLSPSVRGLDRLFESRSAGRRLPSGFSMYPSSPNCVRHVPCCYQVAPITAHPRMGLHTVAKQKMILGPIFSLSLGANAASSVPHAEEAALSSPDTNLGLGTSPLPPAVPLKRHKRGHVRADATGVLLQEPETSTTTAPVEQEDQPAWRGAQVQVAGCSKTGFMRGKTKPYNQDRGLIVESFRKEGEMLVGVMDGHGQWGHMVANYIAHNLPLMLMENPLLRSTSLDTASISSCDLPSFSSSQEAGVKVIPLVQPSSSPSASCSSGDDLAPSFSPLHSSSWALPSDLPAPPLPKITEDDFATSFTEADLRLTASGISVQDSGCTAVVCHVSNSHVTTAWVGDSRAVLGRRRKQPIGAGSSSGDGSSCWGPDWMNDGGESWGSCSGSSSNAWQQQELQCNWEAIPLTNDHKPDRGDEMVRILTHGGRVSQIRGPDGTGVGPWRVWFQNIDYPGLAMSRAFGDLPCKRLGVTSTPELTHHRLELGDELLVVASDGVWEYMSNEEVVEMAGRAGSAEEAAQQLVSAAEAHWRRKMGGYVDDITAVVVKVQPSSNTNN